MDRPLKLDNHMPFGAHEGMIIKNFVNTYPKHATSWFRDLRGVYYHVVISTGESDLLVYVDGVLKK